MLFIKQPKKVMSSKLNASILGYLQSVYLKNDFEYILFKVHDCYLMMLENYSTIENNETKIRNRLYKDYLEPVKMKEKLGLNNWIFHPEAPEIDGQYHEFGRTDLKLYSPKEYLKNEKAYYVIECKRLDGKSALNQAYRKEGINRFIAEKYPTYKNVNGMLGFVIRSIDIDKNSLSLNLDHYPFIPNFSYSYTSAHTTQDSKKDFTLYHLMLDFSSKIK